ncbi:HAD-IA family hydrolase [Microbispora rosea]|uniref:HAD family hydrolase n=1 Tax=Microbispora rosea TaxID=58117 RepID=UPI00341B0A20
MTSDDRAHLIEIIDAARLILLDFDGPVCSIFAGLPAPVVAERLKSLLITRGTHLPAEVAALDDPLKVFRRTAEFAPDQADMIEAALMAAELEAAEVAELTQGIHDVIAESVATGRRVVIVSNNSEPAIKAVCDRAGFSAQLSGIVGRPTGQPTMMKPHPRPVLLACEITGITPTDAVLVGDSDFDMQAATKAGSRSVGLAESPAKANALRNAGADALISSMEELATALKCVADL